MLQALKMQHSRLCVVTSKALYKVLCVSERLWRPRVCEPQSHTCKWTLEVKGICCAVLVAVIIPPPRKKNHFPTMKKATRQDRARTNEMLSDAPKCIKQDFSYFIIFFYSVIYVFLYCPCRMVLKNHSLNVYRTKIRVCSNIRFH